MLLLRVVTALLLLLLLLLLQLPLPRLTLTSLAVDMAMSDDTNVAAYDINSINDGN